MMKYCVAIFTYAQISGYDPYGKPEPIFKSLKDYGYDGVEPGGAPAKIDPIKYKKLADFYDLEIPTVSHLVCSSSGGDPASPNERLRGRVVTYYKKCIDMMVDLNARYTGINSCPPTEAAGTLRISYDELKKNFMATLKEVLEYGEEKGKYILLEPVNRFEAHPAFLNTVREALSIMDEVGMKNTGVFADLFHMNIEEASITGALRNAGKHLRHIHFVDNHRLSPGMGNLNFTEIIQTLKQIKYGGYLSLESYPPKLDPEFLAKFYIQYLRQIEKAVDEQSRLV
jgi:sugar phosphate isomerase/epimerase